MSLAKKIAYNTIISAGARIIGVALSLVSIGLIARYLGQEGFGSYSLILAFLYTFNILADMGLYSLMTREISRPGVNEEKIASNIFTLRILSALFFFSLAVGLVWLFPYEFEVKMGVIIGSAAYFFMSISQVLMGVFQKKLRTDLPSLSETIGRVTQLLLVLLFVFLKLNIFAIIGALIVSSFVIFILNLFFGRKYLNISLRFDFKIWKKLIKATIPIAFSVVLTLIYFKFDSIFLSLGFINRHSGNPIVDVGIYNIAYKVLEGLTFFPAMFVGLIMPLLSKFAVSSLENFKKVFQKALDVLIIFIIPLVAGIFILSRSLVVLVGGEGFYLSSLPLKILSFAIGLIFLGNLFGHSIIALNKQKTGAWIYFAGMVLNVIANLIFIPKYSYIGAAATTVFTELTVTILMLILVIKNINYVPRFNIIKPLVAGAFMSAFICLLKDWNVFVLVLLGVIIYFVTLVLIGGIKKQDIQTLIKK